MLAAAANASSHASTSALTVAARESVPAASPFAQLLRNSRFATYDPQIRKTYYSPQQFVERGYWGLKRPITQRKKNSFVTIKQWETRQHYVEWDNAEDQVRFIRRMEELDSRPGSDVHTKWSKQLGPARHAWLVDSEFCPHQWSQPQAVEAAQTDGAKIPQQESPVPDPIFLEELGKEGPGSYGKNRTRAPMDPAPDVPGQQPKFGMELSSSVLPNVESMSPAEFKRYLAKLRALRPAFKEYLKRQEERQQAQETERQRLLDLGKPVGRSLEKIAGRSLLQLAQNTDGPYLRRFIAEHTESEYRARGSTKIQPQLHRNGGFMYSHPSMIDTLFHTKPKPGIVLDDHTAGRFQIETNEYITSFAGIAALIRTRDANTQGKVPLMDGGVDRSRWLDAVAEMRPVTREALKLENVPRVVGQDPDEGLSGVRVSLNVTVTPGFDDPKRLNPCVPGSREYVNHDGADTKGKDAEREGATRAAAAGPARAGTPSAQPLRSLKNPPKRVGYQPESTTYSTITKLQEANNKQTLSVLQDILAKGPKADPKGDEGL
ncbi:hypothetical protein B0H19DRAFT_1190530 [Mycena capillaripes]|nr:hypothetical protein B0H19DRAFT_1190530 [Mycena capillaripes]